VFLSSSMGEWVSRVASKDRWRRESVRRRDKRTLLFSLNSWRQVAKVLKGVDMVLFISWECEKMGRKGKGGVSYSS